MKQSMVIKEWIFKNLYANTVVLFLQRFTTPWYNNTREAYVV